MRVSVEYFDDEQREPLRLSEEQWGSMAHQQPKAESRAGSAADKLVKEPHQVSAFAYGTRPSRQPSSTVARAVRRRLNSTASKMLSRITGRTIADEARQSSVDVLMRVRDERWNRLSQILRMGGHRLTRQVLLQ